MGKTRCGKAARPVVLSPLPSNPEIQVRTIEDTELYKGNNGPSLWQHSDAYGARGYLVNPNPPTQHL